MKRIISLLLAAFMVLTGLTVPVFAGEDQFLTITEDDISAEGATIEYDSYLSAYKITPVAEGETVTVNIDVAFCSIAAWLPATAADSELIIDFENDTVISSLELWAGHMFECFSVGEAADNSVLTYTPSAVYSIYVFDKVTYEESGDELCSLANGSLADYDEEYLDLDTYEVDRYTKPYWDGDIVFNESFMVIEEKDGTIAPNAMLYEIDRVVSVRNSYLNKEYVYGVDYLIEDGKLVIPEGSSIISNKYTTIYKENSANGYWKTLDGRYVYAGQHNMYMTGYLNITYTVKDTWNGPKPEGKGAYLENITSKLNTPGETVKILGMGDSIAGGANVSSDIGDYGVEPYADPWAEMTSKAIQERYPDVNVEYDVFALGGATATYAIERMNDIIAYAPDLIMIEFGTNECMAGESPDYYLDTLKQAISAINENLPECDIILVAPIISNPLIFPADWFYAYADALYTLERQGVAIADSTSILQYLITRKDYIDMTGDFLCHPNDFANRVFVQTILATLEVGSDDEFIAGMANRITKYRYSAEYDAADWADLCNLASIAYNDILSSANCDEARAKYLEHAAVLDAIPTSAENIANSSLDASNLVFNSAKPLDIIGSASNVGTRFDPDDNALVTIITNARNASVTLDYTKGDSAVSADDYGYVIFTVKADSDNGSRATTARLTYTTAAGACAQKNVTLILDGEYHSYIIDMTDDTKWSGDIASLKLQPFVACSTGDTLYISSLVLATDAENASDIAVERERAARRDAAEAVTYLMADDATSAILTSPAGESYIGGDVDNDGKVSAKDSLYIKRYLADGSITIANPIALDANGDGSVNPADSATVRMTLAGIITQQTLGGAEASVSYSTAEKAAEIVFAKSDVTLTADLSDAGLSADMFKYITVCAKNANGEAVDVIVTLNYADGTASKSVNIPSDHLFDARIAKFTEAKGDIVSVEFTFDCEAGETIFFDSFVFTPTLSAAENAVAVRVGAANLF